LNTSQLYAARLKTLHVDPKTIRYDVSPEHPYQYSGVYSYGSGAASATALGNLLDIDPDAPAGKEF